MSTQARAFPNGVTWEDLKKRNREAGFHYFDADTMDFFDSRLSGTPRVGPDGFAYGVVSNKPPHSARTYEVIRVRPDGEVERPHDPDDPHNDPDIDGDGGKVHVYRDRNEAIKARDRLVIGHGRATPPSYYEWF